MKKIFLGIMLATSLILSACKTAPLDTSAAAAAKYKIVFQQPKTMHWDLAAVEQDREGYAKVYHASGATELAADQSLTVNYGHHLRVPLLVSLHDVVHSLQDMGCQNVQPHILQKKRHSIIFKVTAEQCAGRSMQQTFKVFNMADGQYSIVYAANVKTVAPETQHTLQQVVMTAKIVHR